MNNEQSNFGKFSASYNQVDQSRNAFACIFLFLIPLLYLWKMELVGTFIVFELLVGMVSLPILVRLLDAKLEPVLQKIILLAFIWLASQIVTDMYRHTNYTDYLRGWARICFFLTNIAAVWKLMAGRPERIIWLVLGSVLAGMVNAFISVGFQFDPGSWKTAWFWPFTIGFILLCARLRNGFIIGMLVLVLVVINGVMEIRSAAGICFGIVLFMVASEFIFKNRLLLRGLSTGKQVGLSIFAVFFGIILINGFSALAISGVMGQNLQSKAESQLARGSTYVYNWPMASFWAPLIGGRVEMIVSTEAIKDSPILGHGSWAVDMKYVDLFSTYSGADVDTQRLQNEYGESGLIPTHSHFFGAWVDAGITGGVFWLVLLVLVIRALFVLLIRPFPYKVIYAFFLIAFCWDVFFSPFDTGRRLQNAIVAVMVCMLLNYEKLLSLMRIDRERQNGDASKGIGVPRSH